MKIVVTAPHYEFDYDLEECYYVTREYERNYFYKGEVFKTLKNDYFQVLLIRENTEPDGKDFEIICMKLNFFQRWMYKFFKKCVII